MRFLLKIFAALLAFALVSVGLTYAYVARDRDPQNAGLQATQLPPIIPFRDFFADMSAQWMWRISPGGTHVAWHTATFGGVNISVAPIDDMGRVTTISVGAFDNMYWHGDGERIALLIDRRLWAVDPQSPARDDWEDITPRGFSRWFIVRRPQSADDVTVIASNDREVEAYDLFTTNADGGNKKTLIRNPGDVRFWLLTPQGVPVVRLRNADDGLLAIETRDGPDMETWSSVATYSERDDFRPVLVPAHGEPYFAISNRGRDKSSLVRVNWETGQETLVASVPDADVTGTVAFFEDAKMPDLVFASASQTYVTPMTETGRRFMEALPGDGVLSAIDLTAVSETERLVSFRLSREGKFWSDWVWNVETGEMTALGRGRFSRHDDILAKSETIRFNAADGLSVPAILTRPVVGPNAPPMPTVVRIHGGPAAHASPGYRGTDQFLANRGYVVLSVNFRGSTGYGKAFRRAGYGEVGGRIQDDIADAARWLIEQGIADPDAIAVMGGSYGGYSAALAMTRDPGLFKAGIVDFAVLDVPYQMDNNPYGWGLAPDEMQRYFGDPEDDDDRDRMREVSPITHADKVHGPLLLTHGKLDRVVGFEQTERFAEALEAADKPH
ncbi:MAG: prolyl oligopeptidase family serine peptidase, partial [Pseudomonadota bacterium]